MALPIDQVIDRRKLRRKLTFWRVSTLAVLAALLFGLVGTSGAFKRFGEKASPHIARIQISGVITENRRMLKLMENVAKDEAVKGVILSIDSPGGSTVGGEAMFEAVRNIAAKKPVVASIGTLAASAGYMIASASDHIVARRSSIVGSIGVLFQYPDASELLDKIGVKIEEVKSSPLKAEPSPFHKAPVEARVMLRKIITDSYNWFVDLVTERRPLSREEVLQLADGSIFTGSQGLENKLVDALGGENVAKTWLIDEKGLKNSLKIVEWRVPSAQDRLPFTSRILAVLLNLAGVETNNGEYGTLKTLIRKRIFLDGLVSIWHVSSSSANIGGDTR